jgi:hypothetical protein
MLKRVTGALFEADAGSQIQLVVQARSNNGTEAARFEYDSTVLPAQTILGHPGCTFAVVPAIRQFEAIVVFDPGAPAGARYDLFEVNSAGGLTALGENVTSGASAPLIGFGVDGVRVAVAPMGPTRGARDASDTPPAEQRRASPPKKRGAVKKRALAPRKRAGAAKTPKSKKEKTPARAKGQTKQATGRSRNRR